MGEVVDEQNPRTSAARRPGRRAFSLIELTMVIAIIAIVSAIAAPRFAAASNRFRIDAAARRIVADLNLAQARARSSSASQTIAFDLSAHRYEMIGMADPDRPSAAYAVSLGDGPYHCKLDTATFGADATLVFNGFGMPDSGGSLTISTGSEKRTITMDSTTGSAAVQ
jgi:type II secretion system protein H